MKIEVTRQFLRALEGLPENIRTQVDNTVPALVDAFGKPHAHRGLRKIGSRLYEFRVGLQFRIVFSHEADTLYLLLVGTHDEVRRFIRSL